MIARSGDRIATGYYLNPVFQPCQRRHVDVPHYRAQPNYRY
jgi:hypothetical protein